MKSAQWLLLSRLCIFFLVMFTGLGAVAARKPMPAGFATQKPAAGAALQAGASLDGLYRGTLANQQIVVELSGSAARLEGRYFYSRIGKAIKLKGARLPDGAFRVREYGEKGPSGAEWRLTASGNQATGTFCKCDARQPAAPGAKPPLPIALTRVGAGVTYDDLLLDFPLQAGPEVVTNDQIAYVLQTDTRFKAAMPHITRFPDKAIMTKVNDDLAARLKKSRTQSAQEFQGDPDSGTFSETVQVGLLTREIFSLRLTDDAYSAGAAHPETYSESITYDLRTAGPFDLNNFFRKAGEIAEEAVKGKAEDDSASPLDTLHRALVELYLKHRAKPAEGCEDTEFDIKEAGFHPNIYFQKEGLSLAYELPHAIQGCAEPLIIPYQELAPLVKKDSPLYYLVAGKKP